MWPLIRCVPIVYSTSARFAEVFNTTVSISTPVLKWSPTMRRALIHAISEFVSANMRPLQLASSQTPAASPLVVGKKELWLMLCCPPISSSCYGADHSWLRGSVKTFRWPDANQPDVYGDGLMLQPWNGPTVLFPQLRKHPQCNGVFLAEFNKAKHALSLDIPKPTSFFSSLLNFLRSSVAECSLGVSCATFAALQFIIH